MLHIQPIHRAVRGTGRRLTRHAVGPLLGLAVAAVGVAAAAGKPAAAPWSAHEWGTFLSIAGSDGASVEGMYHEEHSLPAFVHARNREQLRMRTSILKGETPVIYFHSPVSRSVRVDVRFPKGIWTHWYPQVAVSAPGLDEMANALAPERGRLVWCAKLGAEQAPDPLWAPPVSGESLWRHSRAVKSSPITVFSGSAKQEREHFLFYRGLGAVALPLSASSSEGGAIRIRSRSSEAMGPIFVVRVAAARCTVDRLDRLDPGAAALMPQDKEPLSRSAAEALLAAELTSAAVKQGLHPDEASALVNTWRSSYFSTEGVRLLALLPRSWTDREVPLRISPSPDRTVRVMVGRIELLTPELETQARSAIEDLISEGVDRQRRGFDWLRARGRFVEPVVRRAARLHPSPKGREACRRLLATDFVQALQSEVEAEDVPFRPGWLVEAGAQAQLAMVLRDLGQLTEARNAGVQALKSLDSHPPLAISAPGQTSVLRARARALEASGAASAAPAYAALIQHAARSITGAECKRCHTSFGNGGPTGEDWYRGWWAGRRWSALERAAGRDQVLKSTLLRERHSPDLTTAARARLMLQFLWRSPAASGAGAARSL